jgi:hypothetical protein
MYGDDTIWHRHRLLSDRPMSALGQKQTYAVHKPMSALPPIATAKADSRNGSCLLYPPKADMCGALTHVCFGPIADIGMFGWHIRCTAKAGVVKVVILRRHVGGI